MRYIPKEDDIPIFCYEFKAALTKEEYEKCAELKPKLQALAVAFPEIFRMWYTSCVSKEFNTAKVEKDLNGALNGILY